MQTYFIGCGDHVKIGKSADTARRYASLQTSTPERLVLLLVIDGDREKELHARFSHHRFRGEWFSLTEEVQQFIAGAQGLTINIPTSRVKPRRIVQPKKHDARRKGPAIRWVYCRSQAGMALG